MFRKDLGIPGTTGSGLAQAAKFTGAILIRFVALVAALILFSVVVFLPVLAAGDSASPSFEPMDGVNLTNVSVVVAIVLFALAQYGYGVYNSNDTGAFFYTNPESSKPINY